MPRKSKDELEFIDVKNNDEKKQKTKSTNSVSSKSKTSKKDSIKSTSAKKDSTQKSSEKKDTLKKNSPQKQETAKKTVTKNDTTKEENRNNKKVSSKKTDNTKSSSAISKKTMDSKSEAKEKVKRNKLSTKTKSAISTKKEPSKNKIEVLEYYDLPYRYNQTVVKLLAQTPTSLFVYWDISDEDRNNFVSKYGENFFSETKPVLLIRNETMNYTFEIEINDFANCWYLHVNDAKCVYHIELGRKYINHQYNYASNNYIYITSSNKMDAPNDRILFNTLNNSVYFRNVKTNQVEEKKILSISSIANIGKIYNIYDLYKQIYLEENIADFDLKNPSSTCTSSSFKI